MTNSERSQSAAAVTTDRGFLGHPRGPFYLAFTEGWSLHAAIAAGGGIAVALFGRRLDRALRSTDPPGPDQSGQA